MSIIIFRITILLVNKNCHYRELNPLRALPGHCKRPRISSNGDLTLEMFISHSLYCAISCITYKILVMTEKFAGEVGSIHGGD